MPVKQGFSGQISLESRISMVRYVNFFAPESNTLAVAVYVIAGDGHAIQE